MSTNVLRYARPNAEIRGLLSRLLSPAELEALAALGGRREPPREAIEEALRLLERTAYERAAAAALQGGVNVAVAERAVERSLVESFLRVAALLPPEPAALVEALAGRLELDNLKAILRALARGEPPEQVRPLLIPLGRLATLPIDELLRAESVPAAVEPLAGTPYGRALRHAVPRFTREGSLFALEVALDLDYYRRVWAQATALKGADRRVALRMLGVHYDLLNVEWIARFRLLYRLAPEEIFNYTLPYGERLGSAEIRAAAAADDLAGVAAALPEPYRGLVAAVVRAPDALAASGVALHRHLVRLARQALAGYPFHVGVAIAYLWLKEAEVHDLKAIFEGLRFGRQPEQVMALLWGTS